MEGVFGVVFIFILFYILFKSFGRKSIPEDNTEQETEIEIISEKNFAIDDISDQLNTVNGIMEQIKNVEELITDIEVCEPGIHSKKFTLTWLSESGKNLSFQFWVHGGEDFNTDLMLKLSYAQRKTLRTLLKKEIRNLEERSYANVTETMNNNESRGVIYND